jgi:hypothetical protein
MTHHTDPRRIEASLATDRAELAGTLDTLRDRLRVEQLSEDTVYFLSRHASKYAAAAERAVKSNPWAVSMTAAGLAWLIFGGKRKKHATHPHSEQVATLEDDGGNTAPADELVSKSVSEQTFTEKHPAVLAAVALGVGTVLASAFPATRTEDQVFGAERDQLRRKYAALLEAERESLLGILADVKNMLVDGILESLAAAVDEASDTLDKVSDEISNKVSAKRTDRK